MTPLLNLTEAPLRWKDWDVHVVAGTYPNGRIALELQSAITDVARQLFEGARITVATVNIPQHAIEPEDVFVKDYNENEGMADWLVEHGFIEEWAQDSAQTGHVEVYSYQLTKSVLAKLPGGKTVDYIVRAQINPGREAPTNEQLGAAIEVGTEGNDDLFKGVRDFTVHDKDELCLYRLNDREHATVLAALRLRQHEDLHNYDGLMDIATNGDTLTPLDDAEIDALCERLNTGG